MSALRTIVVAIALSFTVTSCVSLSMGKKDGKYHFGVDIDYKEAIDWGKDKWDDIRDKEKSDDNAEIEPRLQEAQERIHP